MASKTPSFAKLKFVHYCAYVLCRILAKLEDKCRNYKGKKSFTPLWKVLLGRFSRNSQSFNKLFWPNRKNNEERGQKSCTPLCRLQYCFQGADFHEAWNMVSILLWKYPVLIFGQRGQKLYKTNAKDNSRRYIKCCLCCAISTSAASFSLDSQVSCPAPIQN